MKKASAKHLDWRMIGSWAAIKPLGKSAMKVNMTSLDYTGETRQGKGTWGKVTALKMQLTWEGWFVVAHSEHGFDGLFSQAEWQALKLIKAA